MAKFVGTPKEFKRFIGPFARNLVQQISKTHKSLINKCEVCGSSSNLEAAHREGEDRTMIIESILNRFLKDGMCEVDLELFENEFREYHKKIDKTIIVLCNSCHKEYDREGKEKRKQEAIPIIKENSIKYGLHKNIRNDRIFQNSEIQKRISDVLKDISDIELDMLLDKTYSKRVFNINFPLLVRLPEKADELTKDRIIKDRAGINRWTWKFQFMRNGYIYAISTQWYSSNDEYVKKWLKKFESPKVQV